MNIALWIAAIALTGAFAFAGAFKIALGIKIVDKGMGWAEGWSNGQVRVLGALELLGAIGLIVPAVAETAEWLVIAAATGLLVVMLGAARAHLRRNETVIPNAVLGAVAAFVAVGRAWLEPFGA